MSLPLLTQALDSDRDVVAARQRAREVARRLGFAPQDQTRVAIAVAEVDLRQREIRYAGIGNVAAQILEPGTSRSLVSMNGTAGQGTARIRPFTYPFAPGAVLVMFSDGLTSRWSLDHQPGLLARHPSLIAGVLYRDHSRRRDDVTVVALRLGVP